jgi:hypothetical protein
LSLCFVIISRCIIRNNNVGGADCRKVYWLQRPCRNPPVNEILKDIRCKRPSQALESVRITIRAFIAVVASPRRTGRVSTVAVAKSRGWLRKVGPAGYFCALLRTAEDRRRARWTAPWASDPGCATTCTPRSATRLWWASSSARSTPSCRTGRPRSAATRSTSPPTRT